MTFTAKSSNLSPQQIGQHQSGSYAPCLAYINKSGEHIYAPRSLSKQGYFRLECVTQDCGSDVCFIVHIGIGAGEKAITINDVYVIIG